MRKLLHAPKLMSERVSDALAGGGRDRVVRGFWVDGYRRAHSALYGENAWLDDVV